MGLEYDFDIVRIAPGDIDPKNTGSQSGADHQVRAVFRDIRTADALRGTSPKIRKMFLDAGFSLESRNSGIARDVFPVEDLTDRVRILRNLFANIRTGGLQGEYCGEFDLWRFLSHVRSAKPMSGIVRTRRAQHLQQPQPSPTTPRRTIPGRVGFALGLAVVLFALFKYLAAAGASP